MRLSIDRTASGSPAGMFRMPMTLNQSNGRYGKVDFIHDKPLDLAAFWEEAHGWEEVHMPRFTRKKNDDPKMLADFRLSALTGFVRMRIHDGCTMEGVRDLTLFCLYNSMIGYYPDGTVMEKVMAVNSLFPVPLPVHEVETYLSTSRKRAKAGKAYM